MTKPNFEAMVRNAGLGHLGQASTDSLLSLLASVYADGAAEAIDRCAAEVEDERSKYIVRSPAYEVTGWCLDRIRALYIRALLPGAKPTESR